jgi:hypothetical protein
VNTSANWNETGTVVYRIEAMTACFVYWRISGKHNSNSIFKLGHRKVLGRSYLIRGKKSLCHVRNFVLKNAKYYLWLCFEIIPLKWTIIIYSVVQFKLKKRGRGVVDMIQPKGLVTIFVIFPSTLKTTRSNFHTTLFQNSFVLVSWPH